MPPGTLVPTPGAPGSPPVWPGMLGPGPPVPAVPPSPPVSLGDPAGPDVMPPPPPLLPVLVLAGDWSGEPGTIWSSIHCWAASERICQFLMRRGVLS